MIKGGVLRCVGGGEEALDVVVEDLEAGWARLRV
jgi:hypothetical protein